MKPSTGASLDLSSALTKLRYTVTDLGVLPGFEASLATGLNDKGQVIGSLYPIADDCHSSSFLWSDGKMRNLGKVALDSINNKGQIAGTKFTKNACGSVVYYNCGKFEKLFKNTSASSISYGINDCGQIVGVLQSTNWKVPIDLKHGCFVWADGKRRYLDIPEGYRSGNAVAINNQGQIAGDVKKGSALEAHACLWSGDTITLFPEPSEFSQSKSISINNQGQILVRAFHSDIEKLFEYLNEGQPEWDWSAPIDHDSAAMEEKIISDQQKIDAMPKDTFVFHWQYFIWGNGKMQPIEGIAKAVNDDGQVVGKFIGWSRAPLTSEEIAHAESCAAPYAFLWQNGEQIDLNDLLPIESGWRLTEANGINNKGQIVGHGEIYGKTRAFLLTPISL